MSDDPQSTAHPHELPAYNSPYASDPQEMDVPADAYASVQEGQPPVPEQEEQEPAQTDETAESYEASYLMGAEDEAPQPEEATAYGTQVLYDPRQIADAEPTVYEEQPSYEEQSTYEEAPPPHNPTPIYGVKPIAPRHTARPAQMRSAPPGLEPKDPDSQILALTYQLQELIAQKQSIMGIDAEEYDPSAALAVAAPGKSRRPNFKPMGPSAALRPAALQPSPNPQPSPLQQPAPKPPGPVGPPSPGLDWTMRAALGLLGLCFLAGIFVAGRHSIPRGVAAKPRSDAGPYIPSASLAWSEATISQLDEALTADQAGEMDRAYRLATDLKDSTKLPIAGLHAYLSNFESRRGNYPEAESLLSTSFDQGVLSVNDQFGFSYTRRRDFIKATQSFTRAIIDNPFSAEGFYRLGESLRRQGNLQDAAKRLKESLARIPAEPMFDTQREWTALKMRLALIEAGRTAELQSEIDAHLQTPPFSGYWTLTAAASALQGGDQLAAAVALGKAKAALPPAQFNGLLSDYFFRAYATQDQVAPFFTNDPAAAQRKQTSRTAYFIDP